MPKLPPPLLSPDPISFLVIRKFPNTPLYSELGSDCQLSNEEEEVLRESEEYEIELEALDKESLGALYKEESEKAERESAEIAEKRESEAWYNQPEVDANFDYWGKMAWWGIDEAIALMLGKNPELVTWAALESESKLFPPPIVIQFGQIREICRRARAVKQLVDPIEPWQFLAWAKNSGLDLPEALVDAAKQNDKPGTDPLANYKSQPNHQSTPVKNVKVRHTDKEIAGLTAEGDELDRKLAAQGENLGPRERSSLLKLILVMAVKKYGYRPGNKNTATGSNRESISSDTEKLGLKMDNETIRKYLKEASEAFSDTLILPDKE